MFRMPIRFSLALGLAAFLSAGPGAAQLPIDQDDLLEDVGQFSPPWFAELQDVEMVGDLAYVFGVGGLGISAVQLARAFGALDVYGVDINGDKLKLAESYGAIPVNASTTDPVAEIKRLSEEP